MNLEHEAYVGELRTLRKIKKAVSEIIQQEIAKMISSPSGATGLEILLSPTHDEDSRQLELPLVFSDDQKGLEAASISGDAKPRDRVEGATQADDERKSDSHGVGNSEQRSGQDPGSGPGSSGGVSDPEKIHHHSSR